MEKAGSGRVDGAPFWRAATERDRGQATMRVIARTVAVLLLVPLALAGAGLADLTLNDGRILYRLVGRNAIAEACLPELKRGLAERGFAPADLELDPHPDIAVAFGAPKTLGAGFTFQDGPAETRVDGIMACVVGATNVHVEFRTNARPVRAG